MAQALAAGVLLFSLLTLAGFAAEDTALYQLLPGRGTSLRTALGFMLASGAVLWLRRDQGVMVALASPTPSSRTLRRLLGPLVLTPILLGMVATWAVRTAGAGLDLTTTIWLFVWGLLVILIVVVWRLACQLYRQDLTRALAEGYRVHVEHAPAPALARVLAQPPGACILDIGLPGMDGRELARRIRAQLQDDTPLLVALTGYGSETDRALALASGFDHYLVKPADLGQLAALLGGAQASPG